jgi:hypothetical protein
MKLGQPLTDRASRALVLFAKLGYLTRSQLSDFLFVGTSITPQSRRVLTGRIIKSLSAGKLLEAHPRLVGGGAGGSSVGYYHLTAPGRRLAAIFDESLPLVPRTEIRTSIAHAVAVAEVVLMFHKEAVTHPGHELVRWQTEGLLAAQLGRSPAIPDIHLVYMTDKSEIEMAIEVDMATERPKYFTSKIARYLDLQQSGAWRSAFEDWPVVLTITPNESRAALLTTSTERYLARRADWPRRQTSVEFAFASLPSLKILGPFGRCWHVIGQSGLHPLVTEVAQ